MFLNPILHSLFEDLQKYEGKLKVSNELCSKVIEEIIEHENKLGGLLEILNSSLDKAYQKKHRQLQGRSGAVP